MKQNDDNHQQTPSARLAAQIEDAHTEMTRERATRVLETYRPHLAEAVGAELAARVLDHPRVVDVAVDVAEDMEPDEMARAVAEHLAAHPRTSVDVVFDSISSTGR